jgi:polyketide cyclase/dehydrase/lipid transport protein
MTQEVHAQVLIDLPRDQAWAKLRDISLAHNYVPGIVKTEIVSEQSEGVGASRYVYRNAKSYIQETVEEWQEGSGFLIHLHRGEKPAPPFKDAWFRYALEDAGEGQTRLTTSLMYEMPWGRLGAWLGGKMAGFVQATISDVAVSMKLYYETGVPTTAKALKAYKASIK